MSGNHPSHVFCHNPFIEFSARGDSIPHKHWEFPKNVDRLTSFTNLFNALLERQNDPLLRQSDYNIFYNDLDEERKARKHEVFPEYIQQAIDTYDLETAFLPSDEIADALFSFDNYLKNTHLINIEKVSIQADELLSKHWKVIYQKHIVGWGENLSENEKTLCDYYDKLLELREALLATICMPNNFKCYSEANNMLTEIHNHRIFKSNETSFQFRLTIDAISDQITRKFNGFKKQALLTSSLVGFMFLTSALLYSKDPEDSVAKTIFVGFLMTALATVLTRCVEKPVKYCLDNALTFFSKQNVPNNSEKIDIPVEIGKMPLIGANLK